ncbi:aldehyde dehydrogenase family protein [Sphingomonas profundi]|uniref:aldehyde dehydrogenase family protein n=1 Tax=Alterirhizorhabdus profundi TaxID=2681549 RepID=UPI0012E8B116|nr:aldehyde dehydrogenase family protein [Sphingomonas profundi]
MTIQNPAIAEWRMLIDGELVPSSSGAVFDNINPATDEVIGVTADGTPEDFDRAIAAARRAFDQTDWPRDHALRARCIRQLKDALVRHAEIIRPLLVAEVGTPIWLTRDTLFDVPVEKLEHYAHLAETYRFDDELEDVDFRGFVSRRRIRYEPVGVVAGIIPWNGPWGSGLGKIGPALASGSTIILKPSPDAPWMGTIVGKLIKEETDIPAGVVNIVTASDNFAGVVLTTDPRVDMIAFTGSAPNGRKVAEAASGTLKRMLLELGGKSAFIVLRSADVAEQAALAAKTICANAGQGCVARSRLLLPRESYEAGIAAAKAQMDAISVGDPQDPQNFMGPLNSRHHRARVLNYIERALADGNRLVRGGKVPESKPTGSFIEPTLFADVKPDDTIAQEEIFGPVLAVIPYDTEEEALQIANNSIYGLSAQVAAGTNEEAYEFAKKLRTGTVSINNGTWMHMDVPFGGFKQSGIGRQYGRQGFEAYLEIKVLGIPSGAESRTLKWGEIERKADTESVSA